MYSQSGINAPDRLKTRILQNKKFKVKEPKFKFPPITQMRVDDRQVNKSCTTQTKSNFEISMPVKTSQSKEKIKSGHRKTKSCLKFKVENQTNKVDCLFPDPSEELDTETEDLLEFVHNLNYEKYIKNLQIREALHLIKNQIESEEQEKVEETSVEENKASEMSSLEETQKKEEWPEDKKLQLDSKPIQHEKPWTYGALVPNCERSKQSLANKILTENRNLKNVHSINSIKRLIEREGLDGVKSPLSSLRISVIKDKQSIRDLTYKPSQIHNLYDLPII